MGLDNRQLYDTEEWSQGYTLCTPITRKWSFEQIQENNRTENRIAFARFSMEDSGKNRQYVYAFSSAELCEIACHIHNFRLNIQRGL